MISPPEMFARNCVWIAGTLKFIPRCAIPASVRLSAPGAWVTSTAGTSTAWATDTGRDNGCHVLFKESGKQVLVLGGQVARRVPHPFARFWRKGGNNWLTGFPVEAPGFRGCEKSHFRDCFVSGHESSLYRSRHVYAGYRRSPAGDVVQMASNGGPGVGIPG